MALQVAGREVDAQRHLVVVAVGEAALDGAAHAVDPHHQLALVVDLLREGGEVEGIVVAQQRRVGLQEEERVVGPAASAAVLLLGDVVVVVATDADDFHGVTFFSL